jgi:hypothetical protein
MVRASLLAALLSLSVPAAAITAAMPAARPQSFEAGVADALRQIKAAATQWTSVSMNIRSSNGFIDVSEPWTRINLNGSGSNGSYRVSGWADREFISLSATPYNYQNPKDGWSVWGSGANVSVRRSGDGYSIWGSVGSQHISATLNRWGGSIWGLNGGNLSISGSNGSYWISGQIDETRFSRSSLAVLGAVVAVAGTQASN